MSWVHSICPPQSQSGRLDVGLPTVPTTPVRNPTYNLSLYQVASGPAIHEYYSVINVVVQVFVHA